MNLTQDLSIIELVINASLVVKLVMLLLTLVSLTSWYWIFRKAFAIRDARSKTDKFERDFWSGGDLNALYQSAVNNRHQTGALERIFEAGYREYTKLRGQKIIDPTAVIDGGSAATPKEKSSSAIVGAWLNRPPPNVLVTLRAASSAASSCSAVALSAA